MQNSPRGIYIYFHFIAVAALLGFGFQNCSKKMNGVEYATKANKIVEETVFKPTQEKSTEKNQVRVNFVFECASWESKYNTSSLVSSLNVKIIIVDNSQKIVCELNGDYRTEILNTKSLSFRPCTDLAPGTYNVYILDSQEQSDKFENSSLNKDKIVLEIDNHKTARTYNNIAIDIFYDNVKFDRFSENIIFLETTETHRHCDKHKSFLVVKTNPLIRLELSAPLDGVDFNFLGKKRISWFAPNAWGFYILTLPNENGAVLNINQLFGESTLGPDGHQAPNAFLALAKYDEDHDNLITKNDNVFSKLRLWNDSNADGIATADELSTLGEHDITMIDLVYDGDNVESDQYGNLSFSKSVVKTTDGELFLIFDLWLRPLNLGSSNL